MKEEVYAATKFLVEFLKSPQSVILDEDLKDFHDTAIECITAFYIDHWFPDNPVKGSGYRCIQINGIKLDPLLVQVVSKLKNKSISTKTVLAMLPRNLTMWIDPQEVSYRFGEHGSICILYETLDNQLMRMSPSPPSTPPNKKLRGSPEPPTTPPTAPRKTPHLFNSQIEVTPPQNATYSQHYSPPNARRSAPQQFHLLQHHQLALYKDALNTPYNLNINCKDVIMRGPNNHLVPLKGLYVSS